MRRTTRSTAHQIKLPMMTKQGAPAVPADRAEQLTAALVELLLQAAKVQSSVPVEGEDDESQGHR
jgi:hypothetical protein